jgi:cytochrome P450
MPELLITDLRAIQHILQDSDAYHKPSTTRAALTHLVGRGVLVTEGDQHRMQRKALNPAFGPGQLRDLTGIFLDKANEVRSIFSVRALCAEAFFFQLCDVVDSHIGSFESAQMEIMTHLSNCTLDIIGLAGFGYSFNAMSLTAGEPNELSAAFTAMMHAAQSSVFFAALEWPLPILRRLVRTHRSGTYDLPI